MSGKKKEEELIRRELKPCFDDIELYMDALSVKSLTPGSIITPADDSSIYFVISGSFKVLADLGNGKRMLMRYCQPPMIIGDVEFLCPDERHEYTYVEIIDTCSAVVLNYGNKRALLENDRTFLRFLATRLAEKTMNFGEKQVFNYQNSAEAKVAAYLCMHAPDGRFAENLRLAAEQLEISYRHLHRVLSKLKKEGLLLPEDKGYRFDPAAMQAYLDRLIR